MRLLATIAFVLALAACGENYTEPIHQDVDHDTTTGGDAPPPPDGDDPTLGVAHGDEPPHD